MKTELEKVAEKLASTTDEFNMFIAGAKWQAERMYSEEEVKHIIFKFTNDFDMKKNIEITSEEQNKWFEQHKKK
jgi:hypothetical protein